MTFCSESTIDDYTRNFLRKIDLFGDLEFYFSIVLLTGSVVVPGTGETMERF